MRAVAVAALIVAALLAVIELRDQPPAPVSEAADLALFSEGRARKTLRHLTDQIGERVLGTDGEVKAREYLVDALKRLPRVEVEVQEAVGTAPSIFIPMPTQFRVYNVLAKLPGRSPNAVLLSAHYDTKPGTLGAADSAAMVGTLMELLRLLAAQPVLDNTVIVNFNGGEESGLVGAMAFAEHPWRKQVKVVLNSDAGGSAGKALLFQTTPFNDRWVEAYARAVPRPYATSIGEEVLRVQRFPSDTDFRIYRTQAELTGLDFALFQDGYSYHTRLDVESRLSPGSIQHLGDNLLALVKELAAADLSAPGPSRASGYYDVLGLVMFVYDRLHARVVAWVLALLVAALGIAVARRTSAKLLGGAVLAQLGSTAAALLGALLAAVLIGRALGRPNGWYAHPWVGVLAYGASAAAAAVAVQRLWGRKDPSPEGREGRALALSAAALFLWTAALLVLTARLSGASHVLLWWVVPSGLALCVGLYRPRWHSAALAVSGALGALVTFEITGRLLHFAIPLSGRFPLHKPFDPVIAAMVGVAVALAAPPLLAALQRAGGVPRATPPLAGLALAGCAALAFTYPYTDARPKRLLLEHLESKDGVVVAFDSEDGVPLKPLLAQQGPLTQSVGITGAERWEMPAPRFELPKTRLEAVKTVEHPESGTRDVLIRAWSPVATKLTIMMPKEKVAGWLLTPTLPELPEGVNVHELQILSNPNPLDFQVTLRGNEKVKVDLWENFYTVTPVAKAAMDKLPSHTAPFVFASRYSVVEL